jgi:hypothetical protein
MSDRAETQSPPSKRQSVSKPDVTPSVETKSDPVHPAIVPASVPLPEPDPALPSQDQEIVE